MLQLCFCFKAWGWVDDDWILILGAALPLSVASSPRGPVFGKIVEVSLMEREKSSPAATTVYKEIKEVEKKNADWGISFLNSRRSGGGQIVWVSVNNSHWSGSKSSALLYFRSHGYFAFIYWGCSLTYGRHWKPMIHNTSIDISTNANVHIHAQGHAARRYEEGAPSPSLAEWPCHPASPSPGSGESAEGLFRWIYQSSLPESFILYLTEAVAS